MSTSIKAYIRNYVRENECNFSDDFVYLYGPYIAGSKDLNNVRKRVAQYSPLMRYIQIAVTAKIAAKNTPSKKLKDTIGLISKTIYDEYGYSPVGINKVYRDSLVKFNTELSKYSETTENFMCSAAPLVPYSQTLSFDYIIKEESTMTTLEKPKNTIKSRLQEMILDDIDKIADNWKMIEEIDITSEKDCTSGKLDKLMISKDSPLNEYYLVAIINHFKPNKEDIVKYFDTIQKITNTDTNVLFDGIISSLEALSSDVTLEAYGYTDKEISNVLSLLQDGFGASLLHDDELFNDLTLLDNFIYTNDFMQFDENSNIVFTTRVGSDDTIVNINNRGANRVYYTMKSNFIICPFTDLRDQTIRFIKLNTKTGNIDIYNDIL